MSNLFIMFYFDNELITCAYLNTFLLHADIVVFTKTGKTTKEPDKIAARNQYNQEGIPYISILFWDTSKFD